MPGEIEVTTIEKLPDELLKRISRTGPAGVFYNRNLLDLWRKCYNWDSVAITDGTALLCGFVKQTSLGQSFFSFPFGWYGGFVGDPVSREFVEFTLEWLRKQRFAFESIVQFSPSDQLNLGRRYKVRNLGAQIVDLAGELRYSKKLAKSIRTAASFDFERRNLHTRDYTRFVAIKEQHEHLTGKKRKVPESFWRELLELSAVEGSGAIAYGLFAGDELLVCHFYFYNDNDIFAHDTFMNQQGRQHLAHFFLRDMVIREAKEKGLRRLNMGSSPRGDAGLLYSKRQWGLRKFTTVNTTAVHWQERPSIFSGEDGENSLPV